MKSSPGHVRHGHGRDRPGRGPGAHVASRERESGSVLAIGGSPSECGGRGGAGHLVATVLYASPPVDAVERARQRGQGVELSSANKL